MRKILLFILLFLFSFNCNKTHLEKINQWLEKEEYEKLLEYSYKNKSQLKDEELYLTSQGISKFQNFIRKNQSEKKFSDPKYFKNLETKTGLKIKWIQTEAEKLIVIEDNYQSLIKESKYYKDKSYLDKFIHTSKTNEPFENSFLLTDILEMDPRLFLSEFKTVWIESMKLSIPANLNESGREKFLYVLHYLASKEETDLKNIFFITEGKNINLRSGPGTENTTIAKLNNEEVFQIDSDYNTTTIGGKTGKWVQIYVWNSDVVGWIFSPFLKPAKIDYALVRSYEKSLTENTNFTTIDFNNWNSDEIPTGFYGNYIKTKKEIRDASIGFTLYPSEKEQGICRKLKKKTKKIVVSFMNEDSSERITIFYLRGVSHLKSNTLSKLEINDNQIVLNSKILDVNIEKNRLLTLEFKIYSEEDSQIRFSILSGINTSREFFQTTNINQKEIDSWELCIPQGKKSSSTVFLFGFNIY
ncbi:MAG: SH3 domain-containing protein [Leptospiraceae bacterium]|nr:SH3 domain-containing protein [Leptospiraceae bacterium]